MQQRMVDAALGNNSPGMVSRKADVIVNEQGATYPNMQTVLRSMPQADTQSQSSQQNQPQNFKQKYARSNFTIGNTNPISSPQPAIYENDKLNLVKQNMMKPEAFKLRANTNSKSIGFEQVLENDRLVRQPNGAGINNQVNNGEYDPTMDTVNTYQYAVAGNLGSMANKF